MSSKTDWVKIKTEYVTTNMSLAKLAKKYHVGTSTISVHARDENWVADRTAFREKAVAKKVASAEKKQVERYERLQNACDALLDKIERAIESIGGTEYLVDKAVYRNIAGALKDIKEVQALKGELDRQEQEARIAKLRREAEKDEQGEDQKSGVLLIPVIGAMPPHPGDDADEETTSNE